MGQILTVGEFLTAWAPQASSTLILSGLFSAWLGSPPLFRFGNPPALPYSSRGIQNLCKEPVETMSIQKKSLISTLKTTKKVNAVSSVPSTMRAPMKSMVKITLKHKKS
jgi:hypothetical protein